MDKIPYDFWRKWLAAYSTGDENAMLKQIATLMPAKASGKVWGILNERQKAEQLNSYYMDLADYINEKPKKKVK